MNHAIGVLYQANVDASKKERFLARCHAIEDSDCISKGFFDSLRTNRNRTSLASIELEDGTCVQNAEQIAQVCIQYFGKTLSTPSESSVIKKAALQGIMQYVEHVVSDANAARLEKPFTKDEIFYALKHLKNDKTPGLDGLSKEFMLQF